MSAAEKVFYATGKRKTSAARVFLKAGSGKMVINGKDSDTYIQTPTGRVEVKKPFLVANLKDKFDAYVTVRGGGLTGQVEAIRHGVTRAIMVAEPETRDSLKKAGYVTRDDRKVERKKYGRHKARKSSQFSKR